MADPGPDSPGVAEPEPAAAESSSLEDLRELLIGPEQDRLRALQSRLDDPEIHARETSQVLPQALALRAQDPALTRALAPLVEQSLASSVRRNPRPLADALFPIMGPAIRKAIAQALSGMVESLNKALEHSLSPRALRWRLTAWRTGRPFAEVVLMNTLLYRVEQLFLIHRTSGLVLHHVTAASVEAQDAGMVSGMLTAIRDFVRDSFGGDEHASLDTLQVGELTVWIEQGPAAVLAAVVRGSAPPELRASLQGALEAVHLELGEEMQSFDGDTAPFAAAEPILQDCLRARYHESRGPLSPRSVWALLAIVGLMLAAWGTLDLRDRARSNRYVERLRVEPGIVVISSTRENGKLVLSGLRDPLAIDPASLLPGWGLEPGDVDGRWQLYQALDPEMIRRRAAEILKPPTTAKLEFEGGTLRVSGTAPAEWIRESRGLARIIPGVARYDDSPLLGGDFERLQREVEASRLLFVVGTAEFVGGQAETLARLRAAVRELAAAAKAAGRSARLRIVGHTDADGAPEQNLALSQARADAVSSLLGVAEGVEMLAVGLGSDEPVAPPDAEDAKEKNRRVSFRVENVPR